MTTPRAGGERPGGARRRRRRRSASAGCSLRSTRSATSPRRRPAGWSCRQRKRTPHFVTAITIVAASARSSSPSRAGSRWRPSPPRRPPAATHSWTAATGHSRCGCSPPSAESVRKRSRPRRRQLPRSGGWWARLAVLLRFRTEWVLAAALRVSCSSCSPGAASSGGARHGESAITCEVVEKNGWWPSPGASGILAANSCVDFEHIGPKWPGPPASQLAVAGLACIRFCLICWHPASPTPHQHINR
ncbi:hypothetical protein T492DRAFT_1035558, partial [Pavlovales sp. CCMP2436]